MYHVYMRNLGDIFEKIPISVSTLYKVSCLFNPTTESSPSFCFFWTPGSSTALVKEFQGFSIRRQPASRIAPKNHGNPCSRSTYLTSVSSVECLCKGATSLCPSWPSCRQIEAPTPSVKSRDISPRWLGGSTRAFRWFRLCICILAEPCLVSARTSQKSQLCSPSSRHFGQCASRSHKSVSALTATAERGSALSTDAART